MEEAARLLETAPGIKYKAALGVAYGAGLRVSEVAHLKIMRRPTERLQDVKPRTIGLADGQAEAYDFLPVESDPSRALRLRPG
ncbi:hypothetical protein X739_28805 [Mesorhizobium sp. LNHC220B00]|nr:hypothetical protein X739_28805 [Mesorhizobium sp. LNHC220B00]